MVCCIIAAYLYAQFVAMLRRWGIYFGLVRPNEWEAKANLPTLKKSVGRMLGRKAIVPTLAAMVLLAGGGWLALNDVLPVAGL